MNRTILSINANRPMNYLLQTVLSKKYNFIAVTDVFAGIAHLRKNKEVSLVLVDLDNAAPEIWDFIEHIGSSKMYQKQVLILSGEKDGFAEAKMIELGLKELVRKPFSPPELVKKIDEMILIELIND